MTKEETIKSIAKTIHRVEFPNSACWYGCDKCSYAGNCDHLKAAEIIYEQYIEQAEIDTARKFFADLEEFHAIGNYSEVYCLLDTSVANLKKKYKVED